MTSEPVAQSTVLNQNTPEWFKTAVFYEVLVRAFRDSNADGTGDFRGLVEKLDYLVWRTGDDKPAQCAALIDAVIGVADTTAGLRIATADTDDAIPEPSLLMGRGPDLAAVVTDVPFLCHFRRATEITDSMPYKEIGNYCVAHRDKIEQVFETLSYFDGVNFAARASAPALFSVGLMDQVCPPSTVFAAHNHYGGEKEITIWQYNGHSVGHGLECGQAFGFAVNRGDTHHIERLEEGDLLSTVELA